MSTLINRRLARFLLSLLILSLLGCRDSPDTGLDPAAPSPTLAGEAPGAVASSPIPTPTGLRINPVTQLEAGVNITAAPQANLTGTLDGLEPESRLNEGPNLPPAQISPTLTLSSSLVSQGSTLPFTATIGLDTFSAYRLHFVTDFTGRRGDRPARGRLRGFFEVTRSPPAQHWRVEVTGAKSSNLGHMAAIELIEVGQTAYLRHPQDGSWLSVPALFANSVLPKTMYRPEDNIDVPDRATRLPRQEMIKGVLTQPYTFGLADFAEPTPYDDVRGTIWVAVSGNYIVRYEATVQGRYKEVAPEGINLLDEGTITMVYEVTDVNGNLSVAAPAGAIPLDLSRLLPEQKGN
jgi:hypothetical protein